MKKHNFSAGPAILPQEVFKQASESIIEFQNMGLSLLEISHRSKEYVAVMEEARAKALQLMGLGDDYTALYLQNGASGQFLMTAYNFLKTKAAYVDTGTWANKAIKEAKLFGQVDVVGSSKEDGYKYIPKGYNIPADADYLHITSNNTIYGTEYWDFPSSPVPVFVDMSSDIYSRTVDGTQFDLIYAGAQKNLGPAGATLVMLKKELLDKMVREVPSMLSYKVHADKDSMFNTPPAFAVYVCLLTLRWIEANGGTDAMEARNKAKADLLYSYLDEDNMFVPYVAAADRSRMNVTFNLSDAALEPAFLEACTKANISGVKGHRSVGGFRASMYNAMELNSVQALVDVMREFNRANG